MPARLPTCITIEDLMSKVDRSITGKDFLSHFAGSWAMLVLKILYYPLKGINELAEGIASLISGGVFLIIAS